jgi:integrase
MPSRRSSFGNVRKLSSGRWQARYTTPAGVKAPAPHTFHTKGDAQTWLATVRADMARGAWKPTPTRRPLTFGEYAEDWLAVRDVKPRTRAHYRTILDRFVLPAFGDVPLDGITPADVRNWYARLETGPTYRSHAYALLRTITRQAAADGHIVSTPCTIPKAGTSRRRVKIRTLEPGEVARLADEMPANLRAMVLIAAWCGLRFGELAELRRKDIDTRRGVIKVRRAVVWVSGRAIVGPQKGEAGARDVAIPPHLVDVLREHIGVHARPGPAGLLFPSAKGIHVTSAALYAAWWPARDRAGLPGVRFHDLRHTSAVWTAQTGATLAELMARHGHSTPQAAMQYQHAAQGRDAEIAAKLTAMMAGDA